MDILKVWSLKGDRKEDTMGDGEGNAKKDIKEIQRKRQKEKHKRDI